MHIRHLILNKIVLLLNALKKARFRLFTTKYMDTVHKKGIRMKITLTGEKESEKRTLNTAQRRFDPAQDKKKS